MGLCCINQQTRLLKLFLQKRGRAPHQARTSSQLTRANNDFAVGSGVEMFMWRRCGVRLHVFGKQFSLRKMLLGACHVGEHK